MGDVRSVNKGIQNTTMAIREEIMKYYKGTCVDQFARRNRVTVISYESASQFGRRHNYERHAAGLRNAHIVLIDCWPFLSLEKMPKAITFHTRVTERSPEFQAIRGNLEEFLKEYLPKVEVSTNSATRVEANIDFQLRSSITDDSGLVALAQRRPTVYPGRDRYALGSINIMEDTNNLFNVHYSAFTEGFFNSTQANNVD